MFSLFVATSSQVAMVRGWSLLTCAVIHDVGAAMSLVILLGNEY